MFVSKVSFGGYDYGDGYPICGGKIEKFNYERKAQEREDEYNESLRTSKLGESRSTGRSGYTYDLDGWGHRASTWVDANGWVHHK